MHVASAQRHVSDLRDISAGIATVTPKAHVKTPHQQFAPAAAISREWMPRGGVLVPPLPSAAARAPPQAAEITEPGCQQYRFVIYIDAVCCDVEPPILVHSIRTIGYEYQFDRRHALL